MSQSQNLITPPPELVQQWWHEAALRKYNGADADKHVTSMAAQWGADQELEACCEWVSQWRCLVGGSRPEVGLRAARRPEPETLNSIALKGLYTIERMDVVIPEITDTIRRALEALPDG